MNPEVFHQNVYTELLSEIKCEIPDSISYSINRYVRPKNWIADDIQIFNYQYHPSGSKQHHLELKFCTIGNMYCKKDQKECGQCKANASFNCEQKVESVDFFNFVFPSSTLKQIFRSGNNNVLNENIAALGYPSSFSKSLPAGNRTRMILEALLNHSYTGNLANIFVNAQAQLLLLYSLDDLLEKPADTSSLKFLANEADREKLLKAKEILLQHISDPITIKALSRKVAMNECYLKKGFKAMFGTTIFDFYQCQRMEHAKYLLYEKNLTVTEVSIQLGYSSISHFSIAFKKHTGLKPCELLR